VAVAMASPVQRDLALDSDASLDRVEQWWTAHDIGRSTRDLTDWRTRHAMTLWQRGLYFRIMGIVEKFVASDLYLTGRR